MKHKGFTLIELMIVLAIGTILLVVIAGGVTETSGGGSMGLNGYVETRCINGVQFVVGQNGSVEQVIGVNGSGVACGNAVAAPTETNTNGTSFQ